MTAETAPGLPAELEAAIIEYGRAEYAAATSGTVSAVLDTRRALVAAIAKYGNTNWLVGYDYRKNEESQEGLVDE